MRRLDLVILGIGGVGRALLRQIVAQRTLHAERYGLRLDVVALADSSGALACTSGDGHCLDDARLEAVLAAKEQGQRLAALPGAHTAAAHTAAPGTAFPPEALLGLLGDRLSFHSVVVDTTATDATLPALLLALEAGGSVVLANKKPLATEQEGYDRLTRAGATSGPLALDRVRWEATCGAGLPVIATLHRLLAGGDTVHRIAGALSGTLGYVMAGVQQGRAFSAVVREAHRLGYTEPDPRDDLGGVDVARKALILARQLGWRLELADIQVEGLYPQAMAHLSVAEFLAALPELDAPVAARVAATQAQGGSLRYAAVVEANPTGRGGVCRVGPTCVPASGPLGRLEGSDNLIEFHTTCYAPQPLVIQGRGAGVDATAAGVLGDIVELAFAR